MSASSFRILMEQLQPSATRFISQSSKTIARAHIYLTSGFSSLAPSAFAILDGELGSEAASLISEKLLLRPSLPARPFRWLNLIPRGFAILFRRDEGSNLQVLTMSWQCGDPFWTFGLLLARLSIYFQSRMRQEVLRKAPLPIHMRKGKGRGKGEDVRLIQLASRVESNYRKAQLKVEIEGSWFCSWLEWVYVLFCQWCEVVAPLLLTWVLVLVLVLELVLVLILVLI